jgi:hypothetical protein
MRTQRLQVRGEHPVGREQPLHRHRGGDVGGPQQHAEVVNGQHEHPQHAVGAVDQRETLLGRELDRSQPDLRQYVRRGPQHALGIAHVPLTGQREGAVCQWGQVTGAAQAAVLRHDRRDAGAQQRGQRLCRLDPDTGTARGQGGQAQQHERPHNFCLDLRPRSGGVRADQRPLELSPHLRRDVPGGQCTEAGGDAVGRRGRRGQRVDGRARRLDRLDRLAGELHLGTVSSDPDHIVEGDRAGTDQDVCHATHSTPPARPPTNRPRQSQTGFESSQGVTK